MKNVIQLTAELFDARDAMRRLHGDQYETKVGVYKNFIRARMERQNEKELPAAMCLVKLLQDKIPNSGMDQALVLAACVELIEPKP
jgi:hypothetical protein